MIKALLVYLGYLGGWGGVKSSHEIEPIRGSISIAFGNLGMVGKGTHSRYVS